MSGHDIFISYSRQERPAARLFAESFAEEGFSVWWDAVLHSGETFDEVIEKELRAAKAVVVLWSPLSVASRWVRAEATQADRGNKLVPVVIEPCDRPIIFELTHTSDLPDWKGDRSDARWRTLVNDLRRLVGPPKEEVPAQESAARSRADLTSVPAVAEAPKEPTPASVMPEAPKQAGPSGTDKETSAPSQEELAEALERLANSRGSVLHRPTNDEEAKAEFFKRSDEFRRSESETVHCLRRVHAAGSEAYHPVSTSALKIGRTAPADIIICEPSVSREHCVVELAAGKLRVLDLNSTNGTYIDNKRIKRAEILPVGSVLRVGNVSFEHEVRTRGEMRQLSDPLGFNPGAGPREPRIARSS